jgi:hypothetical protein
MNAHALFKGVVVDENGNPVDVSYVGGEPMYVVNDAGFFRHIPSKDIDLQVLRELGSQIKGNEDLIADQTSKMIGQDDLFTHAIIENQLKNIEKQYETLIEAGIPEETVAYLGMMGLKVVINFHGDLVRIEQPAAASPGDEGDGE